MTLFKLHIILFSVFLLNPLKGQDRDQNGRMDSVKEESSFPSWDYKNNVGFDVIALGAGRVSLSYERAINKKWGVKASVSKRVFYPKNDLFSVVSIFSGLQNRFRMDSRLHLHRYFFRGSPPYYFFSGSIGMGRAKVSYMKLEENCPQPNSPTSCQYVRVRGEERDTDYLYGGIGGGFEIPLVHRFTFSLDLQIGVLWPLSNEKIYGMYNRGFAWFGSPGVAYHF